MQIRICVCACVGALLLALGTSAWSQQPTTPATDAGAGPAIQPPSLPALEPPPDLPSGIEQTQARLRNIERQKQLVLDTQKLVALTNQLKADVDKSNKDTLSLDVIRKADEIEKLAHAIKDKMKGS
jgi:hypothetical protein